MIRVGSSISSSFQDKRSSPHQRSTNKQNDQDFLNNVAEDEQTDKNYLKQQMEANYLQDVEHAEDMEMQNFTENVLSNVVVAPDDGIDPLLSKYAIEGDHSFADKLNSAHKNPLTELEIEKLIMLIPKSQIKTSAVVALVEQLLACEPGTELALVDQFLKGFVNYAEIYLVLELILSYMKKSGKKKGTALLEVSSLLDEFSIQQGAFLSEFFALSKNPELQESLGSGAIQQIARLNTATITFSTLRQFIDFIKLELKDDFSKLLRTMLKIKAAQIAKIKVLSFEDRYELSEAIKLEYYMFIIYSFFLKNTEFKRKLKKSNIATIQRNGDMLLQLLNLFESSIINEATLTNSLQMITLSKPDYKQYLVIITQLIVLINGLPDAIFANNLEQKAKLINWLRNIAKIREDKYIAASTPKQFSFLHRKIKKVIKYV